VSSNQSLWPSSADRLAARFWPGPLTLVLPKPDDLPSNVTAGGPTWAIRMPDHAVAYALLAAAGPIAAPSANRSTAVSATSAEHVLESLEGKVDLVLDGGPCLAGIESTVLDLTSSPPRILRPGPLRPDDLRAVIGEVLVPQLHLASETETLPSPGTSIRHYAPRSTVECYADPGEAVSRASALAARDACVHLVVTQDGGLGSQLAHTSDNATRYDLISMSSDAALYAASLYRILHEADRRQMEYVVFHLPPDSEDWLAVRDRLRRASTVWRDREPE
jgi:L-threonylcarbamoyladenylate synthase